MNTSNIPIVSLKMNLDENERVCLKSIFENEIKGVRFEHIVVAGEDALTDVSEEGCKIIYLFVRGAGKVMVANESYEVAPETILLPGVVRDVRITAAENDVLHYLKISSKLTAQDLLNLKEFPSGNTEKVYCVKFEDCQSYTEKIKSPNTVSRTILPNKYIPRVAMGTVQAKGPDSVGAHEHPMLEQVFLGLSGNSCTVYADDAKTDFLENAVLHIPLGSSHSVSVEKDEVMYYVWMDFFLNSEGEEWLKTHKVTGTT